MDNVTIRQYVKHHSKKAVQKQDAKRVVRNVEAYPMKQLNALISQLEDPETIQESKRIVCPKEMIFPLP